MPNKNINTSDYWNARYSNVNINPYKLVRSAHKNLYELLCTWVFNIKHKYVLDFGAGCGPIPFLLSRRGFLFGRYVAFDFSQKGLEIAKKYCDSIETSIGRVDDIDIIERNKWNNSFDLVICAEVLEHIRDYQIVINNMVRALKPEGSMLISIPAHRIKIESHINNFKIKDFKNELIDNFKLEIFDDEIVDRWFIIVAKRRKE